MVIIYGRCHRLPPPTPIPSISRIRLLPLARIFGSDPPRNPSHEGQIVVMHSFLWQKLLISLSGPRIFIDREIRVKPDALRVALLRGEKLKAFLLTRRDILRAEFFGAGVGRGSIRFGPLLFIPRSAGKSYDRFA